MSNNLLQKEFEEVTSLINRKFALRQFYERSYSRYEEVAQSCPLGVKVELGAGLGFSKKFLTDLIITDICAYPSVEYVVDATALPYQSQSLSFIAMQNVLHHISDPEAFFGEVDRCLMPGGKILIVDQNINLFSHFILKYLHHEVFDKNTERWAFNSSDPLNDANGAMSWLIFKRDIKKFENLFPRLKLIEYTSHTALLYWLSGGLKPWTMLSERVFPIAKKIDELIVFLYPNAGSFCDVVIEKLD